MTPAERELGNQMRATIGEICSHTFVFVGRHTRQVLKWFVDVSVAYELARIGNDDLSRENERLKADLEFSREIEKALNVEIDRLQGRVREAGEKAYEMTADLNAAEDKWGDLIETLGLYPVPHPIACG